MRACCNGAPISENAMGGWKKEGGGKPHQRHPSQKGLLNPPFGWYVFHPPQASLLCFCCTKVHCWAGQKLFWRASEILQAGVFSGTFSYPHTFCTPPCHGPSTGWGRTVGHKCEVSGRFLNTFSWSFQSVAGLSSRVRQYQWGPIPVEWGLATHPNFVDTDCVHISISLTITCHHSWAFGEGVDPARGCRRNRFICRNSSCNSSCDAIVHSGRKTSAFSLLFRVQ